MDLYSKGVRRIYVYSFPDYAGGYQYDVSLAPIQADFTYLAFDGDISQVYAKRNMTFADHYELFHEHPYDVVNTLEGLVFDYFTR